MIHIEQLVKQKFMEYDTLEVNAKELQSLANNVIRLESRVKMLESKIALYELCGKNKPKGVKLHA